MFEVEIKLFGSLRGSQSDRDFLIVRLEKPVSVAQLKELVRERLTEGQRQIVSESVVADESEILSSDARISSSCALALLPPVCGG